MAEDKLRTYTSEDLEVTWSRARCIHFAACVRGLPVVFDTDKKPWIQPDEADAADVIETVLRCPTGALHVRQKGEDIEEMPGENTVTPAPDGPLYLQGDITLKNAAGKVILRDTRVALCRCGASEHKPLCDGSHADASYRDSGALAQNQLKAGEASSSALTVSTSSNGPLLLEGRVKLRSVGNLSEYDGVSGALCRCGQTGHPPFCDGSHRAAGFEAE